MIVLNFAMFCTCFSFLICCHQKENDNLGISKNEIEVFLHYENGLHLRTIHFSVQNITKNPKRSTVLCKGKREGQDKIDFSAVKIYVSKTFFFSDFDIALFYVDKKQMIMNIVYR